MVRVPGWLVPLVAAPGVVLVALDTAFYWLGGAGYGEQVDGFRMPSLPLASPPVLAVTLGVFLLRALDHIPHTIAATVLGVAGVFYLVCSLRGGMETYAAVFILAAGVLEGWAASQSSL